MDPLRSTIADVVDRVPSPMTDCLSPAEASTVRRAVRIDRRLAAQQSKQVLAQTCATTESIVGGTVTHCQEAQRRRHDSVFRVSVPAPFASDPKSPRLRSPGAPITETHRPTTTTAAPISRSARSVRSPPRTAGSATTSERIAALHSGPVVRTFARETRLPSAPASRTFLHGPRPAPPATSLPTGSAVFGSDAKLSRFLDANDFNDSTVLGKRQRPEGVMHSLAHGVQGLNCFAARSPYVLVEAGRSCEIMRACTILDYDDAHNVFTIEWHRTPEFPQCSQLTKVVKPLQVQYGGESDAAYQQRIERAKIRRDDAERAIRCDRYCEAYVQVSSQPEGVVESILARATCGDDVPLSLETSYAREISLADDVWTLGVQRSVLRYLSRNATHRAALHSVGVDPPEHVAPDLEKAGLSLTEIEHPCVYRGPRMTDFEVCRQHIGRELFTAHPVLYEVLREVRAHWRQFDTMWIVDTDLSLLPLPAPLRAFSGHQRNVTATANLSLEGRWLDHSVAYISSFVGSDVFDFYERSVERYRDSRAQRFFSSVDYLLAGQLLGLVFDTLQRFKAWLESLDVPPELDCDRSVVALSDSVQFRQIVGTVARQNDLVRPSNRLLPGDQPAELLASERRGSTFTPQTVAMTLATSGVVPILAVTLAAKETDIVKELQALDDSDFKARAASGSCLLVFDPPLPAIETELREMFTSIFRGPDTIQGIGRRFFRFLPDEGEWRRPLLAHAASIRSDDVVVKETGAALDEVVRRSFLCADSLRQLYLSCDFLLADRPADTVAAFLAASPPPTLDDYRRVCDGYQLLETSIDSLSIPEVVFPLFRIDVSPAKTALRAAARAHSRALLGHLIAETTKEIKRIDAVYDKMFERASYVPENPAELVELRDDVSKMPTQLAELDESVAFVADELELQGRYGHMPDEETFDLYWRAYSWPRRIGLLMDDLPGRLQGYRAEFIAALQAEKQQLHLDITDLAREVHRLALEVDEARVDDALMLVKRLDAKMKDLRRRADVCDAAATVFQQAPTRWTALKEIEHQIEPYVGLWTIAADSRQLDVAADTALEQVDAEAAAASHGVWAKEITRLNTVFSGEPPMEVVRAVRGRLEQFQQRAPLMLALAKSSVLTRRRHAAKIAEVLGQDPKTFQLTQKSTNDLIALGALKHLAMILEISEAADHEYRLEQMLSRMQAEWQTACLSLIPFADTHLLVSTDPISATLDEHLATTQAMQATQYAAAIAQELRAWERKLRVSSQTLTAWLKCQTDFKYLHPVFTGSDIAAALPVEAEQFAGIAEQWGVVMATAFRAPNVLARCSDERLLDIFEKCNAQLERIVRQLGGFLDTKRASFPRFYFLSNDELVAILSQTRRPRLAVHRNIKKCFDGIATLEFSMLDPEAAAAEQAKRRTRRRSSLSTNALKKLADEDLGDDEMSDLLVATHMRSSQGEVVRLAEDGVQPSRFGCAPEQWLRAVEEGMQKTVADNITRALGDYGARPFSKWIDKWPSQAVGCALHLLWTGEVEAGMADGTLLSCQANLQERVEELVERARHQDRAVHAITVQTLIVSHLHMRDVMEALVAEGIMTPLDFEWTSQLRMYGSQTKHGFGFQVRQLFADIPYGCEYLGVTNRLVITPLTERCFRTLTSAFHLHYGGAPEGPAGTGKTETVKDAAKALGKPCVVYNCSSQIHAADMARRLRGVASTGFWGCFDEFNRIDVQVLSVIAQQVSAIQHAVAQERLEFLFEGSLCKLKHGCSVYITMNPNYAGRAQLPDNLKALFRPVVMVVPDFACIAEHDLVASGFRDAGIIARKTVSVFQECTARLSEQRHYDFGMRALKAVLSVARQMKRGPMREADELSILRHALLYTNVPKFVPADASAFQRIVSDLFGPQTSQAPLHDGLMDCAATLCSDQQLTFSSAMQRRLVQLLDTVHVRHGVMLVGASFGGKTSSLRLLADSLNAQAQKPDAPEEAQFAVNVRTLYPKALTVSELYGYTDSAGEWHEGVFSRAFLETSIKPAAGPLACRDWIVLDGPVDAGWIESLNSVLDETRKLTLSNGALLPLGPNVTIIVETENLQQASPATVSRCGVVYYDREAVGCGALISAWLTSDLPAVIAGHAHAASVASKFLHAVLPSACEFACRELRLAVPVSPVHMCASTLRFLATALPELFCRQDPVAFDVAKARDAQHFVEATFSFGVLWGVGAFVDDGVAGRPLLERWLRGSLGAHESLTHDVHTSDAFPAIYHCATHIAPNERSLLGKVPCVPTDTTCDCLWLDWSTSPNIFRATEENTHATTLSQEEAPNSGSPSTVTGIHENLVLTTEIACSVTLLRWALQAAQPVAIIGESGAGKSLICAEALRLCMSSNTALASATVRFSARDGGYSVRELVRERVERRGPHQLAPPPGRSMLLVVDDVCLPQVDSFGARSAEEQLRQILCMGGWHDPSASAVADAPDFCEVLRVAAVLMIQTRPGDVPYSERTIASCRTLHVATPQETTARHILRSLFEDVMNSAGFAPGVSLHRENVARFVWQVFSDVRRTFPATPRDPHYRWTFRHAVRVIEGLSVMDTDHVRDEPSLYTALAHESVRVFADAASTQSDRGVFGEIIGTAFTTAAKHSLDVAVSVEDSPGQYVFGQAAPIDNLLFADFTPESNDGNGASHGMRHVCSLASTTAVIEEQVASLHREALQKAAARSALASGHRRGSRGSISEAGGLSDVAAPPATPKDQDVRTQDDTPDIVVFDHVIYHVVRLVRILRQSGGNALLVGPGGSGRATVARLSAAVAGFQYKTCAPGSDGKVDDASWRRDLSSALRLAGERQAATVLLVRDGDFGACPKMQLQVCEWLRAGEVRGLFGRDAMEQIATTMRPALKSLGVADPSLEQCWDRFRSNCASYFRLMVCVSPVGSNFATLVNHTPSLAHRATVDYFHQWSSADMSTVARRAFDRLGIFSAASAAQLASMHRDVESLDPNTLPVRAPVTPDTFLLALRTVTSLGAKLQEQCLAREKRYHEAGAMLEETSNAVSRMRVELAETEPQIVAATKLSEELHAKVAVATAAADEQRAVVAADEAAADAMAADAKAQRDECEANLAVALPAYNAATSMVSRIEKPDLVELRSMHHPPERMKKVLEALCVVLEVPPVVVRSPHSNRTTLDYWTPTKQNIMSDVETFRSFLLNFDKDNMKPEVFEGKLQPYIKDKSFRPEAVRNVSKALVSVCEWVIALELYYRVQRIVQPKRERLAIAEAEFQAAAAVLAEKKALLADVEQKVADLRTEMESKATERDELVKAQDVMQAKLRRAVQLLQLLGGEGKRYESSAAEAQDRRDHLEGDVMMCAAQLVYLAPLPSDVRERLFTRWCSQLQRDNVALSPAVVEERTALKPSLTDAPRLLRWHACGLASDAVAIDNAVAVSESVRVPFVIDPHGEAVAWLLATARAQDRRVHRLRATDSGFVSNLRAAAATDCTVIIEDASTTTMNPAVRALALAPPTVSGPANKTHRQSVVSFVRSSPQKQGDKNRGKLQPAPPPHRIVMFGDTPVPVHQRFQLILHTSQPEPVFLPEVTTATALVGFFVTEKGLTELLTQRTVQRAHKAQDERRVRCVEQQANGQQQLRSLEDEILDTLAQGEALLESDDPVELLQKAKETGSNVARRLAEAADVQKSLQAVRERYTLISRRATGLFFVLSRLSMVNSAYRFSLTWFLSLYGRTLDLAWADRADDKDEPDVAAVLPALVSLLATNVHRAIFSADGLLFSFVATAALREEPLAELSLLAEVAEPQASRKWACPERIAESKWRRICSAAETLPALADLPSHLIERRCRILDDLAVGDVTQVDLARRPVPLKNVTDLQYLIVVRCVRPELLTAAVQHYVEAKSASPDLPAIPVSGPPVRLKHVLVEYSGAVGTPVLLMLAPGADGPLQEIERLAAETGLAGKVDSLSLGHGVARRAEALIDYARLRGRWVVLQNAHLCEDWLPTLGRVVDALGAATVTLEKPQQAVPIPGQQPLHATSSGGPPDKPTDPSDIRTVHAEFRLWVTSMPSMVIPASLILRCVTCALETPQGVRANIRHVLSCYPLSDDKFFNEHPKLALWRGLCYSLCVFHAVALERRRFGPIGWSNPARFNTSDLVISARQLRDLLLPPSKDVVEQLALLSKRNDDSAPASAAFSAPQEIPYRALHYLVGECHYGGRVTDKADRAVLQALLRQFLNPAVARGSEITAQNPAVGGGVAAVRKVTSVPDPVNFHPTAAVGLPLPPDGPKEDFSAAAEAVGPDAEDPEIFGLHSHTNAVRLRREADAFVTALHGAQPNAVIEEVTEPKKRRKSVAAVDRTEAVNPELVALCTPALEQLPKPLDDLELALRTESGDEMRGLLAVEVSRYALLLREMRSTLEVLLDAARGLTAMLPPLEEAGQALLHGSLPASWNRVCYATPKLVWLLPMVNDVAFRVSYLREWFTRGPPVTHRLDLLFSPGLLLATTLSLHAESVDATVDSLSWSAAPMAEHCTTLEDAWVGHHLPPQEGCLVAGMHLEGCRWDPMGRCLRDGSPDTHFPVLRLQPVAKRSLDDEDLDAPSSTRPFACVVYRTSDRNGPLTSMGHNSHVLTTLVLPAEVPDPRTCNLDVALQDPAEAVYYQYTLRGAALVLDTRY